MPELEAVSRLCGGDLELARHLLTEPGRELRAASEAAARSPRSPAPAAEPWRGLLESAEAAGRGAGAEAERRVRELAGREERKLPRDATEQIKRVERRARTAELDLALGLVCSWYRDLAAFAEDALELAMYRDRLEQLAADAEGLRPERAREALELVLDTRRRLRLNVSEELAFDALWHRLATTLGGR